MNKYFANIITLICLAAGLASCEDNLRLPDELGPVPEGEIRLETVIRFSPLNEALAGERQSRSDGLELDSDPGNQNGHNTIAPAGDSMGQVSSLHILFYSTDGNLLASTMPPVTVDLDSNPVYEERTEPDASNGVPADSVTLCVKTDITIPYGNYKIMAVANIPDLLTAYADDIRTIDGLRSIKLKWNTADISKNTQMFGYFTAGKSDTRGRNFEAEEPVYVRPDTPSLHAWVRRAVSKLTIDFDGSGLRENVYVYIKEAKIYDIADGCYLGHYSCVGPAPSETDVPGGTVAGGFGLSASSHRLVYGKGDEYENWPVVATGQKFDSYKDGKKTVKFHDEKAFCLPFYENMQGNGRSKYQDADQNGSPDYPDAGEYETDENGNPVLNDYGSKKWLHEEAKDSKPNGTYVEVTGYYESKNEDYVTSGPIKFRFMLGKNIKDNYDCERNHHYKLTLRFLGHGNEADWHIEYEEAPGIHMPNPLYISYLYNRSINLPIRINTGGHRVAKLEARITSNNWAPDIPDYDELAEKDRLKYHRKVDEDGQFGKLYPWNGFLSLIETHDTYITPPAGENSFTYNQKYWQKEFTDVSNGQKISRGYRIYNVEPGEHTGYDSSEKVSLGNYSVSTSRNVFECLIPLYSRAKQLVEDTGYTGNNPFAAYQRKAMVEVVATLDNGETITSTTEIIQVRRVVNPKGIYRERDNNDPFKVELLELERESSTSFRSFDSKGPWRAIVAAGDAGFINLDGKQEIEGSTLSPVKFTVNFSGTCPEGQNRYAVIRVEYNNYNCDHLIFVSQGDAPVQLFKNGPLWHSKNMKTKDTEVDNPLDEGSLFRFARWDYPIDACNNIYTNKAYWVNVEPGDFNAPASFKIAGNTKGTPVSWATIGSAAAPSGSFDDQTNATTNTKYKVATVMDYYDLHTETKQGYGVLYGNDADGVQKDIHMAYGYLRDEDGKVHTNYGMRGCFAYVDAPGTSYHGKHIFFPIGASGYGRRKHSGAHGGSWGKQEIADGVLRYATGRVDYYTDSDTRPLFYDIFRREGALYFAKKQGEVPGSTDSKLGLDINYFSFDFRPLSASNFYGAYTSTNKEPSADHSDACFIRCID